MMLNIVIFLSVFCRSWSLFPGCCCYWTMSLVTATTQRQRHWSKANSVHWRKPLTCLIMAPNADVVSHIPNRGSKFTIEMNLDKFFFLEPNGYDLWKYNRWKSLCQILYLVLIALLLWISTRRISEYVGEGDFVSGFSFKGGGGYEKV